MLAHCTAVSKDNQVEYWQTEKNILLQILVFIMNAYCVSGLVLITSYTVYRLLNPSKNYELEILITLPKAPEPRVKPSSVTEKLMFSTTSHYWTKPQSGHLVTRIREK